MFKLLLMLSSSLTDTRGFTKTIRKIISSFVTRYYFLSLYDQNRVIYVNMLVASSLMKLLLSPECN